MYTRDYTDAERLEIPVGYGGTLLEGREVPVDAPEPKNDESTPTSAAPLHSRGIGELLKRLPFGNFFGGIHMGKEEMLIIAAALFLFLSKDGDKECAIMLIILLFIT